MILIPKYSQYPKNRMARKAFEKEQKICNKLLAIDYAMTKAINDDVSDFEEAYNYYNSEYKKECHRINASYNFRFFKINENHIEQAYGKKEEIVKPYKKGVSIIQRIINFVNRFK